MNDVSNPSIQRDSTKAAMPPAERHLPLWVGHALGRLNGLGVRGAALMLLALLLVKAVVDVDGHFDSWWYHLPWAARLAGLVSADAYQFEPISAVRFAGFPMLPEFLQGLLWRMSGRVESANLVNFGSLIVFILFLQKSLRVPWWLATPALLAVPLVQAHATSTYVDLIANLAMAALVLLVCKTWITRNAVRPKTMVGIFIAAAVAANSKFQLLPIVALALTAAALPALTWIRARTDSSQPRGRIAIRLVTVTVALMIVFMVPLKNLFVHHNPAYPLQVRILGHVLPGAEAMPPESLGSGPLSDAHRIVKWAYSVGEFGMGDILNVQRWSLDSSAPAGSPLGMQGGLFGMYVGFHALLFAWLVTRVGKRQRAVALAAIGVSCGLAALMPASHLLRYYMFWFFCLIGINLHFLASLHSERIRGLFAAIFLLFVLVVIDASDQNFIRPRFQSAQQLLDERVDARILAELDRAGTACLALARANQPFLYASIWHAGSEFSIKAGPFDPANRQEVIEACEGRQVIFSPD